MPAHANDAIVVTHPDTDHMLRNLPDMFYKHLCPAAVPGIAYTTTRDVLDFMALGTCRYCGQKMP